jgi:hypothetical protein
MLNNPVWLMISHILASKSRMILTWIKRACPPIGANSNSIHTPGPPLCYWTWSPTCCAPSSSKENMLFNNSVATPCICHDAYPYLWIQAAQSSSAIKQRNQAAQSSSAIKQRNQAAQSSSGVLHSFFDRNASSRRPAFNATYYSSSNVVAPQTGKQIDINQEGIFSAH